MQEHTVQKQVEFAQTKLSVIEQKLQHYLNYTNITVLEREGKGKEEYPLLLSDLRRLSVHCLEAKEACTMFLTTKAVPSAQAQQLLKRIYQRCVLEFFNPKNDLWYENSRASYTGSDAIHFRFEAPNSVHVLFRNIEETFLSLQEELQMYEKNYFAN
ncbi:DUF3907 family protein [Priestia endophytica]|uniref:DUF3907 family protein n=1 Tax=Priestia endophytica TaxID=135735 RepID=UPI000F523B1E|nr:DUF3907 family protein [Priestia endophytica]RPK15590.1 hypothetical protein FH5_01025 [Priestia endophytica]